MRVFKRLLTISLPLGLSLVLTGIALPVNVTEAQGIDSGLSGCNLQPAENVISSPLFSVLTLNMAHKLYVGELTRAKQSLHKIRRFELLEPQFHPLFTE